MARPAFATDISRDEFESIRGMLEAARRKTRPRKHDLYDVFCAVLYFLHSGAAWRSMPPDFPPWRTVHEYFMQWTSAPPGKPALLETALAQLGRADLVEQVQKMLGERGS